MQIDLMKDDIPQCFLEQPSVHRHRPLFQNSLVNFVFL